MKIKQRIKEVKWFAQGHIADNCRPQTHSELSSPLRFPWQLSSQQSAFNQVPKQHSAFPILLPATILLNLSRSLLYSKLDNCTSTIWTHLFPNSDFLDFNSIDFLADALDLNVWSYQMWRTNKRGFAFGGLRIWPSTIITCHCHPRGTYAPQQGWPQPVSYAGEHMVVLAMVLQGEAGH